MARAEQALAHEKGTPSAEDITLRPMGPTDGPALATLYQASPDTGQIQIGRHDRLDLHTPTS